jgi:hypothetical protein
MARKPPGDHPPGRATAASSPTARAFPRFDLVPPSSPRAASILFGVAVAIVVIVVGARSVDLYAGPWEPFARPARAFLSAAEAGDSVRLARLTDSLPVVRRALAEGREAHIDLRGRLQVMASQRAGDTTRLTYAIRPCLVVLTFTGSGRRARVVDFSTPCRPQ